MTSINTNASAMTALMTLRSIDNQMDTTQNRIATGFKVASAKDNAAYWSIATTMRSETSSLGAVSEALGIGASQADVASTAVQSLTDLMSKFRDRVVASGQPGVDKAKLQTEIDQLGQQMVETVNAASFNGENWLKDADDAGTATILSGITKTDTATSIQTISVALDSADGDNVSEIVATVAGSIAAGVYTKAIDLEAAGFDVDTTLTSIDTAIKGLTELGSVFGAASTRVDLQQNFNKNLGDALDRGIGALVDADMSEELTRLKALQTQQQLGIQALSIANSSSQNILSLFR